MIKGREQMIFTIDRIQYSKRLDHYFVFEFLEIKDLNRLLNMNSQNAKNHSQLFWQKLYEQVNVPTREKLEFLRNWDKKITRIFIIYQKGIDAYIKIVIKPEGCEWNVLSFNHLQQWFKKINNMDQDIFSRSKGLGVSRDENVDRYVNHLLRELYKDPHFIDDNGLELTKALLDLDWTNAIDFDMFQYIPSTNEYIIYEFLKRDSRFIDNIQAHPMRYSWTGKYRDNKQKYIAFWRAKQFFNAKLYLINYSDNMNEKISIIEVVQLDEKVGFIEENKYVMSRNVFLGWLKDMNNYQKRHNNYLADFKSVKYDHQFFSKYRNKKFDYDKIYGNEFSR